MKFQTRPGFQLIEGLKGSSHDANRQINGTEASACVFRLGHEIARPPVPFASISFGNSGGSPTHVKETHTSLLFPSELCHKAKPCASLAGLGVRAKKILGIKNINIYGLGIYADAGAAKKALAARYKGASEEALGKDQQMFDDIIRASFEKSLRLVISYGSLKRSQFLDALGERMEPKLKLAGDVSSFDQFKKLFDDVTFTKGTEIVFVQEGAKLITKVDGAQKGSIHSPSLCRCLFDIYLGADPVAPDAKAAFGKSLAAAVKR